jgi:hypothetical protein
MFRLPTYDVTLWYWVNPETTGYRERLIKAAEAFPSEATEYQGMQDMHWGTEQEAEAKAILEKLKPFVSDPNIVLLRLDSSREDFEPITYKDERPALKGKSTLGHA